jgi:hypothetical protein
MSDMDGSYGQSSLATLNIAYNNSRISTVQPLNGSRRPSRASYKPSAGPPPASALPAPPTNVQRYSQQHLRLQTVPSNPVNHPYSAQAFASTPDSGSDLDDGLSSGNERQQRHPYRLLANTSGLMPGSQGQGQGFNPNARQLSASSFNSHTELPYQYPSHSAAVVPPGSYFAAYPPHAHLVRDPSGSSGSDLSIDSPSQYAPNSGPLSGPGTAPTAPTAPLHMYSASQPIPQAASQNSSNPRPQSTTNKTRPSSRRALTAALELAKSAVQLDATNDDPHGAVLAYAKSVQLLSEVMERVMRGEDPPPGPTGATSSSAVPPNAATSAGSGGETEDRRRVGRRRSVVAKEEEVRRLKAIVSSCLISTPWLTRVPSTAYAIHYLLVNFIHR